MVQGLKTPLTIFIQYNYALVIQVAGKYLPSSDVIKNLRAGTPREAGAEARALLSGDPLHTQRKPAAQDKQTKGHKAKSSLAACPTSAVALLSSCFHLSIHTSGLESTKLQDSNSLFSIRDQCHLLFHFTT